MYWSSEFNSPILVYFSSLILKLSCSLLPSPVWPLLIYLDSWPSRSRILCNIVLYSTKLYFRHQSHAQLGIVFALASFFLELFLCSSLVAYWAPTNWGVHLSVSYLFVFSFSWGSQGKKWQSKKWFAIPFSSEPHFVRTLHHDSSFLGGPTWHGSQFHWIRQGWDPCDKFD